ncbi:IS6 family transposase [Chloroflexota bacterium]
MILIDMLKGYGMVNCKFCDSSNVVKYGTHEGVQRYWCKDCKRKFADNDALPEMKTPIRCIASALSCYFGGMPLDSIQRHLQQQFNVYYSKMGIYNWVKRFAKEAIDRVKDFQPIVGDTWIADETCLKVGGNNIWFWDVIDAKTRYLLASRLSKTRTTKDATLVMKEALKRAGKAPKRIIIDKLAAYIDGIELVFGADTEHIQSKPFTDVNSTNIIERFQGTLKDRTKIIRGFKRMDTAELLTEAWLVHYNFFKEHETLGNIPPAVRMGATPIKDWEDVIKSTKVVTSSKPKAEVETLLDKLEVETPTKRVQVKRKARHPKRKPKGLKLKPRVEISLSEMRLK